jgi:hypothetical protein
MHHSVVSVNTRCLRRSVRPSAAAGPATPRAAAVTCGFTGGPHLMQR